MTDTALKFRTLPGPLREYVITTRSFAFQAGGVNEARDWQQRLHNASGALLGGFPERHCDLSSQILGEHNDYLDIEIFEGEHTWNGLYGHDWLDRWL